MPTYDYQCRSCGAITEVIHAMTEDGPSACDRCGGELRRVLYPAGIIFKGSGFYRTDSRSAGSSTVSGSGSGTSGSIGSAGSEAGGKDGAKPSTESKGATGSSGSSGSSGGESAA